MVVQRRYLDAAFDEFLHHGIDLFMQEHEIAHHHRLASHFLEREIGTQGKSGSDLDPVKRDLQVAPPETDAVNSAGQLRTGSAERLRDWGPVVVRCDGGGGQSEREPDACDYWIKALHGMTSPREWSWNECCRLSDETATHRGWVTVVTLPFWAMSTTATGLWFLIAGVIEKTVPVCVFRTSAITAARLLRPSDITASCSADLATWGTSLKTSTFGAHLSCSGLPLNS